MSEWVIDPPPDEFSRRLTQLREAMETKGFDAFLVFSDEWRYADVRYLTDYRTWTANALGGLYTPSMVVVPSNGDPTLFVPDNNVPLAERVSAIKDIRPWGTRTSPGVMDHLKSFRTSTNPKTVGFESATVMPVAVYNEIAQSLSGVDLQPSTLLADLRAVKSEWELGLLEKATQVNELAMDAGVHALTEGMTEWELAAVVDGKLRSEGCDVYLSSLLGFGPNSAPGGMEIWEPSWETRGNRKLRKGDCVAIDLHGVVPQGYSGDVCRGIAFGEVPQKFHEIAAVARESLDVAIATCRVGATAGDVEMASHGFIEEAGYGAYYPHEGFHGLGLEVEERPFAHDAVLVENMVVSVESGIYLPDSMGIRLEDVIAVTAGAPKVFGNPYPHEINVP